MNNIKTIGVVIVSVILSIVGISIYNSGHQTVVVGSGSGQDHYNYETFIAGAKVNLLTSGGGIITVSTTSATYTLTQAQLEGGNVISVANTGTAALALTLPATSTMTTLIKTPGDSRRWFIQNLHTAAATTTTITAGTGIDLQGITANDDVINGAVTGVLDCYRQASTNVVCVVKEYVVAD
jgi:hypothetical protein